MKKYIIFLLTLLLISSQPCFAVSFTTYKKNDGLDVEKNSGGGSNSSNRDGGSDSGSAGTKLSAEDEATHNSQQDIRKGLKDIISRIKGTNFKKISNNGDTMTYAGKARISDDEIKKILSNYKSYESNWKKGEYGNDFNSNAFPRTIKAPKLDMTSAEKKTAQKKIVAREKVKSAGSSSSSNNNAVTKGDDGKVQLNPLYNTQEYDPPGAKYGNYVQDLISNGVRDFKNWNSRYETLKNYYEKRSQNNYDKIGTGTISGKNAMSFLSLMAKYESFIKNNNTYLNYGYNKKFDEFIFCKTSVDKKTKISVTNVTPPTWAFGEMGMKKSNGSHLIRANGGTFAGCYSGDIKNNLKRIKIGYNANTSAQKGLLKPGDICTAGNQVFVYSGVGKLFYNANKNTIKGSILENGNGNGKITEVLRWNEYVTNKSSTKGGKTSESELNQSAEKVSNFSKSFNSMFTNPAIFLVNNKSAGVSLEDFEDVAYVESYTLTSLNRSYYKIVDWRSDKKRYRLKDSSGKVIKEGKMTGNEINFDDVTEPGKYTLDWDQWATVRRGTSVGYVKRQYLVLLPSNTLLYYKETLMDDTPVFIKGGKTKGEWVHVDSQIQEIKDTNAIDTGGTLIERTE